MITLDRIKIKSNYKYLLNKDIAFNQHIRPQSETVNGEWYNSSEDSRVPFNLVVGVDYDKQTLTLEFSSKILGIDYPKLISKQTIRHCLENLNQLGVCTVDIDSIIATGAVISMDVTVDIPYVLDENDLISMNNMVGAYRRYKWNHYTNDGITFTRDVKSKDCKESLVVYLKGQEIVKKGNQMFLSSSGDKQRIIDYFTDKTRFEVSITNAKKIRNALCLQDNYLTTILDCDNRVILSTFDRVFGDIPSVEPFECQNYEEYAMMCVLERNNYDMKKTEQELRNLVAYSTRSGLNKRLKKLQEVNTAIISHDSPSRLIKIRTLLEKCIKSSAVSN